MTSRPVEHGSDGTNSTSSEGVTTPVGPLSKEWLGRYDQVHMNVFGQPARVMDHGKGVFIWDLDGNKYLDMVAGIAVNALGYAHPAWNQALEDQAAKMSHISNYFASVSQVKLAERLLSISQAPSGSRVFFANSGTESNEAAIKLARLYGSRMEGVGKDRPARILALTHGFHGRSMGSLSATWKPGIRVPFEPLLPGVEFVQSGDSEAMEEAFQTTGRGSDLRGPVAAVIMELIQGESGVRPLEPEYVARVRDLCTKNGALMIVDEVQTGMGRTGHWFAFQDPTLSGGAHPDVLTFAKGVAGGFPMGGMITFGSGPSSIFTPGMHGSTFAGSPLASAMGLVTLDTIDKEGLIDNAQDQGERLRAEILKEGNPLFQGVRGRGLLNAVQLAHPCSHALAAWVMDRGLIVNPVAADAIRLAPPLIISSDEIDQAVSILSQVPLELPDD